MKIQNFYIIEHWNYLKINNGEYNMGKILNKILEVVDCLTFVSMILISLIQIISRYILKSTSVFSEEFLIYLIIWVSMLRM